MSTLANIQLNHACVLYSEERDFNGRTLPKLYIQTIDAYRYQRELTIELRREPGSSSVYFWECHAYKHPGQRNVQTVTKQVAESLIERILHLARNYPTLLFNENSETRARHEGFVHFHDRLLAGFTATVKMLD